MAKRWNAADIEMVVISSDTPIPARVLHTNKLSEIGLKGQVLNRTQKGRQYRYYYPGILDSLLHVEVPNQLHVYLLPAIHAGQLEQWCFDRKLVPYRFKTFPSGKYANKLYREMQNAFYAFIRDAEESEVNSMRWISNSQLSPDAAVSPNTPILNEKIVSKMWFIDWTPDRIGTQEFIERHGLSIDPLKLKPVDEIVL
jgi:hypothetical protein